ncbi:MULTISPECIES: hypothetical protein [Aequorivita]|uniref:Thymidylate synthase n=2 Tax=Aequorivita TaxID=153265 RepID=A0AB35YVZ3_9FLAO|nr:hypothetical protein [Aequorivita sp. Ant34-E75]WGF93117.1 hypothetical protein QCQ61_02770 [Aequorivita sp. Ant34-E75]
MEKKYELSTGILECYPFHALFYFKATAFNIAEAKELSKALDTHYRGRKCVVISTREFTKTINPLVYQEVPSKSVVGVAIVSNSENVKNEAIEEQGLFKGSFGYFNCIEEAANWAETVVN